MGKVLSVGRFVLYAGLSKSGAWHITSKQDYRHTPIVSIGIVSHNNMHALQVFLGPVHLKGGYAFQR